MEIHLLYWALGGVVVSELVGYWLHRLLHSDKIHWLSKNHMIHHLKLYGPKTGLRSKEYRLATVGRAGIGSIGAEWLIPAGIVTFFYAAVLWVLQVDWLSQLVFMGSALLWTLISYNYLHDTFHLEKVWLMENRFTKKWFLWARHLHDIHHLHINNEGLMDKNFGIGFWYMDILFKTYQKEALPFDEKAFEAAKERYAYIDGEIDHPLPV